MKVLLDHNVNRRLRHHLAGHEVITTSAMGWQLLQNGVLLRAAASSGFQAFITIDKNIEFEQNLSMLTIPVVVIDAPSSVLAALLPFVPSLMALLKTDLKRSLYVVSVSGHLRVTSPREGR